MAATASASRPPKPPKISWSSWLTQMFPPKPTFTEIDLPDLSGKVYIVTGSNTGVGKEVAQILYSKNAKVYIAARSEEKANHAIADIQNTWPQSKGSLVFLYLDLADLSTIKPAVERFTSQESKLHVLFNNAAVQALGNDGSTKTAQGHEMHIGVNVLGVFLFAKLLTPILVATAKTEAKDSVRVVWVSSLGTEIVGEKSYGLSLNYLNYWPALSPLERYGISKAGSWLHGVEFAKRYQADGVVSISCNPGHLRSDLYREGSFLFKAVLSATLLHPPVNGAYTELFAGLSPELTMDNTGEYVVPWGRLYPIRPDLLDATKSEKEGGNDHAKKFWDWSEEQVREYA
ncbi:MAG: Rab geranylgeranyltransferase [Bathelium mastoideum]|nr:MAG: Rab geranylgeranyltransferase [Bathelium mastoideum]